MRLIWIIRIAAIFVFNLLLAAWVTTVIVEPFNHGFDISDLPQMIRKGLILSAVAAFGLGFSVFWTWRRSESKWVWVVGVGLFAERAFRLWIEQRGMFFGSPHTVLGQLSGSDCSATFIQSCNDALGYSYPLVRTVFYSLGAFCASPVPKFHFDALKRVFPGLFSMIGEKDNPD
jgi:hypothetical protein